MISVIIPVLNEERALPGTLAALFAQRGAPFETLVVDGGSTDRTLDIAASHPGPLRIVCAPKGRASQMNAGASAARGEWLLFLHADTLLPEGALARIVGLEARCLAGGFRHRFSGADWRLAAISALDNLRCRRTRIFYGDQAPFVRRATFDEVGGFPARPVLEDVAFSEALNRVTRPVLLASYVLTDSRKFEAKGIWRSLVRVAVILTRFELGLPVDASHPFFEEVR